MAGRMLGWPDGYAGPSDQLGSETYQIISTLPERPVVAWLLTWN